MEFGSLGLGPPSQPASNQTGGSGQGPTATLDTNPENTVTPVDSAAASQNDRQQDLLGKDELAAGSRGETPDFSPEELQLTSRRTTLNFDSEQNRIFLEIVDTTTEEVIERIPSEGLVKFVQQALDNDDANEIEDTDESSQQSELAV